MEHRLKKRKGTFFTKFIKLFITALLLPCCLSAQSPETSHLAYGNPGKADTIVERPGYALGYIERHEQAAWVIYIISDKQILAKNAERSNYSFTMAGWFSASETEQKLKRKRIAQKSTVDLLQVHGFSLFT